MLTKTKFLFTASVMSAVYIAGLPNAVAQISTTPNTYPQMLAVDTSRVDYVMPPANALGHQRYIVRFSDPAVAQYNGAGERAAIPRNPDNSIQVNTPAVQSYVAYLKQQQNTFLTSISSTLGRNITATLNYQYAYNGMAVYLAKNEVSAVMNSVLVAEVMLDKDYILNTDVGPQLIGADNVWTGTAPSAGTALGEGVVIGILDTGINFDHPSFADVGDDGYDHTNPLGLGNFLGVCDSTNIDQFDATYTCNDKLIGGYDFINSLTPEDGTDLPGPEDENGHGSHVASTAAGNMVTSAEMNGITGITVSGVAPHATVVMYDVCFNNAAGGAACAGAASIAAVDQVLADGIVNVINFSIGGGVFPWLDPVSQAFLSATDSGIFVATSAGNSGPGPGTLSHVEPWTSSSGASTHNRQFSNTVDITGPGEVPMNLTNLFGLQGTGPVLAADLVGTISYAGIVDAANSNGCNAFVADAFDGVVALISRGGCGFLDKINNVVAAGAIGVIVHNNNTGAPIAMAALEDTTIPSVMIEQVSGADMVAFITANPTATVSVAAATLIDLTGIADSMAPFSSRGPSPIEYNKPDVTAPGVSILAAFNDGDVAGGTPAEYGVISGTSMSSPHNAGAAALLKELNPSWSSAEIKSAIMMTAVTAGITKEDRTTPADPFDRGSGRVQVDVASSTGLVMNETAFKFLLADPDNGGDPKTLNVPNLTNYSCIGRCGFQRKFKSVAAGSVDYTASITGITGTVNPSTFTVSPGQTITLDIEIDGAALTEGVVSFGELLITPVIPAIASVSINPDNTTLNLRGITPPVPALHLPAVIIGFPEQPEISVAPTPLNASLQPNTTTDEVLTINNELPLPPAEGADLDWAFFLGDFVQIFAEQIGNLPLGTLSGFFTPNNTGFYTADDFTLSNDSSIDTLSFAGFVSGEGLNLADVASSIEVRIFANLAGDPPVPAMHPEDGAIPVASLTIPISDPSLDLTNNGILIDVVAATGNTIDLAAGTYWVTVFPVNTTEFTEAGPGRWLWTLSTFTNGAEAVIVDPSDLFDEGFTTWSRVATDVGLVPPSFAASNYLISGIVTCGAPWLSLAPETGVIIPDNSTDVTVTFDSTGLTPGDYSATLCIDSNDPDQARLFIPVNMTVEIEDLIFMHGFETPTP